MSSAGGGQVFGLVTIGDLKSREGGLNIHGDVIIFSEGGRGRTQNTCNHVIMGHYGVCSNVYQPYTINNMCHFS